MAQVKEWAAERGMRLSHFLKQAADAYVRNEDGGRQHEDAEDRDALFIEILNHLNEIEHVTGQLRAALVEEDDYGELEPRSGVDARMLETFNKLHTDLHRVVHLLVVEGERATKINTAQEGQLRQMLAANDDPNRHRTFTERLMRKMRL